MSNRVTIRTVTKTTYDTTDVQHLFGGWKMRGNGRQDYPFDKGWCVSPQQDPRALRSHLRSVAVEDVAREVIRSLAEQNKPDAADKPSEDQIEHLCFALISDNDQAGATYINDARSAGASAGSIYLKYLASAARKLGDWWDDDLISFGEVTIGSSRIYAIMRAIRLEFPVPTSPSDKTVVFASVPGETHTLGVQMATDLLRRDGWQVELKVGETHDQLLSGIEQSNAEVIGLSAAGDHSTVALTRLVAAIRMRKPTAAVFVSGHVVEVERELLALLDIDGMVSDVASARLLLASLWDRRHSSPH